MHLADPAVTQVAQADLLDLAPRVSWKSRAASTVRNGATSMVPECTRERMSATGIGLIGEDEVDVGQAVLADVEESGSQRHAHPLVQGEAGEVGVRGRAW